MRHIAVLAKTRAEYDYHVTRDILPGLEKYHKVKFTRDFDNGSYECEKFKVFYASSAKLVQGLRNWQLIKVGQFFEHPEAHEIEALWEKDKAFRNGAEPTVEVNTDDKNNL